MKSKRNGLLEIYRLIFCFWVMSCHDFFFLLNTTSAFSYAHLAVDFFFILSGFFLMNSMRKRKDEKLIKGTFKLLFQKLKPLLFTMGFIFIFNMLCVGFFIREDLFDVLFEVFRYWWYILYLVVAISVFYLIYRAVRKEFIFIIIISILAVIMGIFHYEVDQNDFLINWFTFLARTFGCISLGILISYIPHFKTRKFNINIIFVILIIPILFFFAYNEKTYLIRLIMITLFCCLVYFSSNINVTGKAFDIIGMLSVRMYLYMSFISMLDVLGVSNNRLLFIIDVFLSILDLCFYIYKNKYKKEKKQ